LRYIFPLHLKHVFISSSAVVDTVCRLLFCTVSPSKYLMFEMLEFARHFATLY